MNPTTKYPVEPFIALGVKLRKALAGGSMEGVIRESCAANPWFTPESVRFAIEAICTDMLQPDTLERWLHPYESQPAPSQKRVGVIMAGNIPLVGFFDLMCVLLSGHTCLCKPSSKDKILMEFVVRTLLDINPSLPLQPLGDTRPDAVIATGSDNTNRYFRTTYRNIPALLRGSRTSIAVLDGDESESDLAGLATDIFTYFGMGCRNVSRIFVPHDYDLSQLADSLRSYPVTHPPFLHGYRQAKAMNTMTGRPFTDGVFFILRESDEPGCNLSEITCTRYTARAEAEAWIAANDSNIQCIVSNCIPHPRRVGFGQAQHPRPEDYPDGVDTMRFLLNL